MAIAFDAAGHTTVTASGTSHTQNHTCSGADRVLLVGIGAFDSPYDNVTAVTYNGVAMTQIGKKFHTGGRGTYLYILTNPDTGTNQISITTSANNRLNINSLSFTGAAQTGQPEISSTQETTATTKTMTLNVSTDQSILVGSEFTNRDSTAGTNTTRESTSDTNASNNNIAYSTTAVGTGNQSLVLTQSDATWAVMVFAVITPATAGGANTTNFFLMM